MSNGDYIEYYITDLNHFNYKHLFFMQFTISAPHLSLAMSFVFPLLVNIIKFVVEQFGKEEPQKSLPMLKQFSNMIVRKYTIA